MLKIKDKVNLDSLLELDLHFNKVEYPYGTRYERKSVNGVEVFIYSHNRIIQVNFDGYTTYIKPNSLRSNLVYDLIDKGYVEEI